MNAFKNALRSFHNDEGGMEAMQTVVILAIAALVLLSLNTLWGTIEDQATNNVEDIMNADF